MSLIVNYVSNIQNSNINDKRKDEFAISAFMSKMRFCLYYPIELSLQYSIATNSNVSTPKNYISKYIKICLVSGFEPPTFGSLCRTLNHCSTIAGLSTPFCQNVCKSGIEISDIFNIFISQKTKEN